MRKLLAIVAVVLLCACTSDAFAAIHIDNDITAGTVGHFSVTLDTGGESRYARITANRLASSDVYTTNVLFDYFSYVDVGTLGGAFRLNNGSDPASAGDDAASSSGSFLGVAGNTISWSVTSSIPNNGNTMTSTFTFSANTGTLGALRFYQYLDEDVEGFSNDVFFTRGSVAGSDLELFTVDNTQVYGISHSGALSSAQGLANSSFTGWAANTFDNMRPAITGGTQSVSTTGVIQNLPAYNHPNVGSAYGPRDIVSVLAWNVDPNEASATIITTLGGVPDVQDIPDVIPEPSMFVIWSLLAVLGFTVGWYRRRKAA